MYNMVIQLFFNNIFKNEMFLLSLFFLIISILLAFSYLD